MSDRQNDHLQNLKARVAEFPRDPGVYLMKDIKGRIIYVGKAKALRDRVRQYFGQHDTRYQVTFLMQKVHQIDFIITATESEALLLENSLIKKHKPRYNVFLKDDKTYLGLKVTIQQDFPRFLTTRKIKKDGALYYGPFTSSESLYTVKEFIDHYFQLRTCSDHELQSRVRPCLEYQIKRCSAPCVNYVSVEQYKKQIEEVRDFLEGKNKKLQTVVKKRMQEASDSENFEEAARLRDLLLSMEKVLEKQKVTHLSFGFSDIFAFERRDNRIGVAILMIRDGELIDSRYHVFESLEDDQEFLTNVLTQLYRPETFIPHEIILPIQIDSKSLLEELLTEHSGHSVTIAMPQKGEKKSLLDLAQKNLESHFVRFEKKKSDWEETKQILKEKLCLQNNPDRIECYDISNISGEFTVGSMVTFVDGEEHKAAYKKFKIKTVEGPNDFASMKEVLLRRFSKKTEDWQWPDLVVCDGGKGQMSQVLKVFEELNVVGVDVVAIAKGQGDGVRAKGQWDSKKEDELYLPGRKNPVLFKPGSAELSLLQNLRDESHRFAITFHRQLRDQTMQQSVLDQVPGLGAKRKSALLKVFGSPQKVLSASKEELQCVPGISQNLAELLIQLGKSFQSNQ